MECNIYKILCSVHINMQHKHFVKLIQMDIKKSNTINMNFKYLTKMFK